MRVQFPGAIYHVLSRGDTYYGDLIKLYTFQGGSSWSSSSWPGNGGDTNKVTIWNYDPATGLVVSKLDATGKGWTNVYHPTRTLWTHTTARGLTVTNTFNGFGELLQKWHSGSDAPSMTINQYNSLGMPEEAIDPFSGTVAFGYDYAADGALLSATHRYEPFYDGLVVTNRIDPVYGPDRVVVDCTYGNVFQVATDYQFDTTSGRLQTVKAWYSDESGSSATNSTTYGYLANSDLVQTLTAKQDATTVLTTTKSWDYGYRLRDIRSVLGTAGAVVSSFGYVYDDVDRRTRATLQDGSAWGYDYDDRNEVISGKRFWADYSPVAGQQFEYLYDSIGNRKQAKEGGDAFGQNLRTEGYGVNNLNQYTVRTNSSQVDIVGAAIATTVSVNGNTNVSRHGEYYHYPLTAGSTLPVLQNVTNVATQGGSVTTTGALLLPSLTQSLQHDADGNLTNDTVWGYSWDAENRLTRMETVSAPTNGVTRLRLDFGYDWHGRRAIKTVLTNWNGSVYQTTNITRYVYALSPGPEGGWNLLAELNEGNAPLRTYAWGLDLSGSLEGAGGIGGLLSATHYSPSLTTHFTTYDGNGNVMALVKTDGTSSARYEYGPFGEPIRASGTLAKVHPFRWSTKFWDEETGLVYYGYRYYSPSLGRWISRDPIEEDGGLSLYGSCRNSPLNRYDVFGLDSDDDDDDLDFRLAIAAEASGFYATYAYDDDLRFMHQQVVDEGVQTMKTAGRNIAISVGMCIGGGIAGKLIGKAFGAVARMVAKFVARKGDDLARIPIGRRGGPISVASGTNPAATIGGREYTGHALDQMQRRGIMPSVVENAIKVGQKAAGNSAKESVFIDPVNRIKVVVDNASGRIVTVVHQ